jgi:hypothetical protein
VRYRQQPENITKIAVIKKLLIHVIQSVSDESITGRTRFFGHYVPHPPDGRSE